MEHGIHHNRSQALVDHAYRFAKNAHAGQLRKYTNEPYIVHPVAVARIVASVTDDVEMICAALLHDVIEDCEVTKQDLIEAGFGYGIAYLVEGLSDISKPEDGNREKRKAIDRNHLSCGDRRIKTIKLADLIHNSESIERHDHNFSVTYMREKNQLLDVLTEGNATLLERARDIVHDYYMRTKLCKG